MSNPTQPESPAAPLPPDALASGGKGQHEPVRLVAAVSGLIASAQEIPAGEKSDLRRLVHQWLEPRFEVLTPEGAFSRLAHEIWRIRARAIPTLVRTFVPDELQQNLLPIGTRGTHREINPVTLLSAGLGGNGDHETKRRRFEAQRELALGYYSLWLVTDAEYRGTRDTRRIDQSEKSESDRDRFIAFLRHEGVIAAHQSDVLIRTAHDTEPPYRCTGIAIAGQAEPFVVPAPGADSWRLNKLPKQDLVTMPTPDGDIKAFLTVRRKGIMQTIAKMLLLGISNPRHVPDRRGIRFAYRDLDELRRGSQFVSERIGLALARKEHMQAADPEFNPYAAPNLVLVKDTATYMDREIEIQNFLATQHVDLMTSHGPENSTRYHRRQYTDPKGILPQLFPPDLYGIDWQDELVQLEMDRHIIAPLPT